MKKLQVRAYQTKAVAKAFHGRNALLIVSPGGSGKTIIAARIVRKARRLGLRVLIISHRREIIRQTVDTLRARKEKVSIILGDETSEKHEAVIVASISTLARRKLFPEVDIVIIDEAHRTAAASYVELVEHYKKLEVKIIGLTATPRRLDGLGLYQYFDELYEAAKPSQLFGKYIMKPITFSAPPECLPDLMGVEKYEGDFNIRKLVSRINKLGLVGGIVDHVKKHWQEGRLGILFACSIKHSKNCEAALRKAGFRAKHIDGNFSPEARDQVLEDIKNGKIDIICCCLLLTEGWDLPECDTVILARPTCSETLFIQMANRCSRVGKHKPIILDHACNTVMHKYSWIDREWSLDGIVRGDPKKLTDYRTCKICRCTNDVGAAVCINCGNDLKKDRKLSPAELAHLQLVEWSKQEKRRRAKKLRDFAKKRGFNETWVKRAEELWDA